MTNRGLALSQLLVIICVVIFFGIVIFTLVSDRSSRGGQVKDLSPAAEGLDLKTVTALVNSAENADDLEKKINTADVNNLDLDGDGIVDYIRVEEYGSGESRGFSLVAKLSNGEEQEVATISVAKEGETHVTETHGNEQVYGNNHYHRHHGGNGLFYFWLFSSRSHYRSSYGYGSYPRGYQPYAQQPTASYRQRTGSMGLVGGGEVQVAQSSALRNAPVSPNAGKNASSIAAPLRNPTSSQRAFQSRRASAAMGRGGFGSSQTGSVRSSSSMRSGGFFGGGK